MRKFRVTIDSNVFFDMDGESEKEVIEYCTRSRFLEVSTPDSGLLMVNTGNVTTIHVRERVGFEL